MFFRRTRKKTGFQLTKASFSSRLTATGTLLNQFRANVIEFQDFYFLHIYNIGH